ncbi:hypothetical protein [Halanaerobacter jeridensis]|uniref:Uncharacterized protein n=1 Tax=Halanaerobacter jeridensis TaxID=706427 RepID=A0A938XVV2_9FIRM|nr:hypothetical protein [Halanaerobacter jeridensis]MBM7557779.1 hypothetical protein [Halanaerobacter jeridensis]
MSFDEQTISDEDLPEIPDDMIKNLREEQEKLLADIKLLDSAQIKLKEKSDHATKTSVFKGHQPIIQQLKKISEMIEDMILKLDEQGKDGTDTAEVLRVVIILDNTDKLFRPIAKLRDKLNLHTLNQKVVVNKDSFGSLLNNRCQKELDYIQDRLEKALKEYSYFKYSTFEEKIKE